MRLVAVILRPKHGQLRECAAQKRLQPRTDRVFRLEMARVDQVDPEIGRVGKFVVLEVGRHERIAPMRQYIADRTTNKDKA